MTTATITRGPELHTAICRAIGQATDWHPQCFEQDAHIGGFCEPCRRYRTEYIARTLTALPVPAPAPVVSPVDTAELVALLAPVPTGAVASVDSRLVAMVDALHAEAEPENRLFDEREAQTARYMSERACFDQSTSWSTTPAHRRPYVLREALATYAEQCEKAAYVRADYASRVREHDIDPADGDALDTFVEWAERNIQSQWDGNGGENCTDGTNRVLRWLGLPEVQTPCQSGDCEDSECDECRPETTYTVTVRVTHTYSVTTRSDDTDDVETAARDHDWQTHAPEDASATYADVTVDSVDVSE